MLLSMVGAPRAFAQETAAAPAGPLPDPIGVTVEDTPNDNGTSLTITWAKADGESKQSEYEVELAPNQDGPYRKVARSLSDATRAAVVLEDTHGFAANKYSGNGVVVTPLQLYSAQEVQLAVIGPKDIAHIEKQLEKANGDPKRILALFEEAPSLLAAAKANPAVAKAYGVLEGYQAVEAGGGDVTQFAADRTKVAEAVLAGMRQVTEAASKRLIDHLGPKVVERAEAVYTGFSVTRSGDLAQHLRGRIERKINWILCDREWFARVNVIDAAGKKTQGSAIGKGRPAVNWFAWTKLNNLLLMVLVGGTVMFFIAKARKSPEDIYLRRIAGLDAVDEALGRSTEMGKPVLFAHGLTTMQDVATIAAVNILGEIAKHVAKFDTKLLCANVDPIVLSVSQETVRESFTHAGRPDAYNEDDVFLAGADQFSYVAAVDGIMLRQKPAANFYVGYFYAESLILAETGAASGAIQIAATDAFTQLPFFVTTCDYTLMGEELYAASAYLSRDPLLLGSLKGQDIAKALFILVIVIGTIASSLGFDFVRDLVKVF
jgi:hypothetical protein